MPSRTHRERAPPPPAPAPVGGRQSRARGERAGPAALAPCAGGSGERQLSVLVAWRQRCGGSTTMCDRVAAAWRSGGVMRWQRGDVAWQRGSVVAWQRGSVAAWRRGGVAAWRRGGRVSASWAVCTWRRRRHTPLGRAQLLRALYQEDVPQVEVHRDARAERAQHE